MDSDDTDMGSWETNSQRDSDEKGENVEISSTILNDLKRLFPSIDNWYLIGSGRFGSVYLGKTEGGFHTLVKRIHLDVFDQQEVTILRKIKSYKSHHLIGFRTAMEKYFQKENTKKRKRILI